MKIDDSILTNLEIKWVALNYAIYYEIYSILFYVYWIVPKSNNNFDVRSTHTRSNKAHMRSRPPCVYDAYVLINSDLNKWSYHTKYGSADGFYSFNSCFAFKLKTNILFVREIEMTLNFGEWFQFWVQRDFAIHYIFEMRHIKYSYLLSLPLFLSLSINRNTQI